MTIEQVLLSSEVKSTRAVQRLWLIHTHLGLIRFGSYLIGFHLPFSKTNRPRAKYLKNECLRVPFHVQVGVLCCVLGEALEHWKNCLDSAKSCDHRTIRRCRRNIHELYTAQTRSQHLLVTVLYGDYVVTSKLQSPKCTATQACNWLKPLDCTATHRTVW